ncbi:MAG TPA: hypothetical protein VG500_11695 [Gemmatimonadales bacterium]|jgi:hypothetical protein|nr:hypothetical protein [Gemmatimonadales bacterium]
MRHTRLTIWTSGLLSLSLALSAAQAQSGASAVSVPDSVTPSPDSGPAEGKKKGGLFGKVKGLAGNKVVQSVAKTAACTMVPGGQVIVGAIDAASSKDVGEGAADAAATAAGVAGAGGSQACMPGGMGGMGMDPGAAAAGAMPGMPGVGAAGAAGLAGSLVGGLGGGEPGEGMPAGAMGYGAMPGMPNPEATATCLGISTEEYLDFSDPTRGQARQPTKDELKRQSKMAGKIDMRRYQACMMQQATAAMAGVGGQMVPSRAPAADAASAPEDAVADGKLSEASGKQVELASDLSAQLAKGRTLVKDIDWLAGGGEVSEAGRPAFLEAMGRLAAAIQQAGGTYTANIYLDKRYDEVAVEPLGSARIKAVLLSLEGAGVEAGVVTAGKTKKDKNPRLEIVKAKK